MTSNLPQPSLKVRSHLIQLLEPPHQDLSFRSIRSLRLMQCFVPESLKVLQLEVDRKEIG
jgi:hypothetical protein